MVLHEAGAMEQEMNTRDDAWQHQQKLLSVLIIQIDALLGTLTRGVT